jgi:hypothetical protein
MTTDSPATQAGRRLGRQLAAAMTPPDPNVPTSVDEAMALAFARIGAIQRRDIQAGSQRFKALKLDDVYDAARTVMAEVGLYPRVEFHKRESGQRESSNKQIIWREDVDAFVCFRWRDGNEVRTGPWPGRGEDSQDKSFTKAISYAMKAAVIATFMIPGATDDPDENGPGETVAARRDRAPSRPSQPRVDWRTTPHEFAGKPGKACPKCGKPQDDGLHRPQESGRSADPETGEHNDAHEPTDDHDHGDEELDAGLAEIGYAQDPETNDHWHPNAHSVTDDDWQAGPAQPDEPPF